MWGGVFSGLAGEQLSGSPKMSGKNRTKVIKNRSRINTPSRSLIVQQGWNGILSASEFKPVGLFEPVSWRNSRWTITRAAMMKGRIKWNAKKRVRVALSTEKPPQIHSTRVVPI